jgi:hypothetical protein
MAVAALLQDAVEDQGYEHKAALPCASPRLAVSERLSSDAGGIIPKSPDNVLNVLNVLKVHGEDVGSECSPLSARSSWTASGSPFGCRSTSVARAAQMTSSWWLAKATPRSGWRCNGMPPRGAVAAPWKVIGHRGRDLSLASPPANRSGDTYGVVLTVTRPGQAAFASARVRTKADIAALVRDFRPVLPVGLRRDDMLKSETPGFPPGVRAVLPVCGAIRSRPDRAPAGR